VASDDQSALAAFDALSIRLSKAREALADVVFGQDQVIDEVLVTLLCGGHGLLVGTPGLAKTRLVKSTGIVLGLTSKRVQFTPDLMPADILGSEVLETAEDGARSFRFIEGPIFCQLLMADEINRASPRTQSALLQAMQEKSVTVGGANRPLGRPFHVLATQNPIEQEGTYPLPEAQLDRFLVEVNVPYPDRQTEKDILIATTGVSDAQSVNVFSTEELMAAQVLVRRMPVGDAIVEAILDLVRAFRPAEADAPQIVRDNVSWGPGPRAAQAFMLTVRAQALLQGRLAPSMEDVIAMAKPVLSHRMALSFSARARGEDLGAIIDTVTAQVTRIEAAA